MGIDFAGFAKSVGWSSRAFNCRGDFKGIFVQTGIYKSFLYVRVSNFLYSLADRTIMACINFPAFRRFRSGIYGGCRNYQYNLFI